MPLALEFHDKHQLWYDLIRGNSERVFVPFNDALDIGMQAPVELALPGLPIRIVVVGTIVGRRRKSRRFASGAFLRFSPREIDKCRAFLGLSTQAELFEQTRKARRADCDIPLRFVTPGLTERGTIKNVSESGFRAIFPVSFHKGQRMRVALQLERGQELETNIEISWAKRNETLVGAKFLELSAAEAERIGSALDRFLAAKRVRATKLILVADDDASTLDLLRRELGQQGFEVRAVRRGDEALSLARQLKPEMVILEALVPGLDGVDVCTSMRADAEMADIPVLLISGLPHDSLQHLADVSGATNYLCKPFDMVELFRSVADALSQRPEN